MSKFNATTGIPDLTGKVALVTGGNRGMGFHIVQQLANHGAKVYLAARSEQSARDAIAKIESENSELKDQGRIVFLQLDLSTLKAAKSSAEKFKEQETRLDILIHNAGIMNHPYAKTTDGMEDCMAINHFAPFVFTRELFSLLVQSSKEPNSDVRVVIVSSEIHPRAPAGGKFLTLEEINDPLAPPASQDGLIARYARYARSKLANILYAKQLQAELAAADSPALAISINPGGVATDTVLEDMGSFRLVGPILRYAISKFAKTPLDGALTALHAATAREVREQADRFAGAYTVPYGKIAVPSKDAQDTELAKKLWEFTGKLADEILSR